MADIPTGIDAQIQRLHRAADAQESSSRVAGVNKEAAILSAMVAAQTHDSIARAAEMVADALNESHRATTRAAANVVAALDRNTAAADRSSRAMFWLTLAYVALTGVIAFTALFGWWRGTP
jgi:hypothetical protein